MNCWDFNKCGRQMGGAEATNHGVCAAWPDNGKRCAFVVGTMSQNKNAIRHNDVPSCWVCDYYRSGHHLRQ